MYAFQIELAEKYNYLSDKFKAAYEWLRTQPLAELAPGGLSRVRRGNGKRSALHHHGTGNGTL